MNRQKGFVSILLILLVLIVVGGRVYFYTQNSQEELIKPEVIQEDFPLVVEETDNLKQTEFIEKDLEKKKILVATSTYEEVKTNVHVDLNLKNPNIVTGTYYYPTGIIPNVHTEKKTSKCVDVSKDDCDNASIIDFILKDQENLNNEQAPIFTTIYEPAPFQTVKPIAEMVLTTNNTMLFPSGNKVLLVQLIQTNGGRSNSFISAVVFSNNAHQYFPINTYVGKYKDYFIGPFLEEQAWFVDGQIVLVQKNANIGAKGQHIRALIFSFDKGDYTLINEKYTGENLDRINDFMLKEIEN